ncbi:MAG TPA: YihY/virulence factor BrkB family protein [Anaerolineales bacterium]|nr:YihY/virulence factor BrkB family protein [Anaerolineales bacterium]
MKFLDLLRATALHWSLNQAPRRSAALTYYAMVSLAALIVLLLAVAGLFFNPERVSRFLVSPVAAVIGEDNSGFISDLTENYYNPGASFTAGALSLLIVLNTGSTLFIQLGKSLNEFLNAKRRPSDLPPTRRILQAALGRLRAFAFVLAAELLLLAGLFASTGLQLAHENFELLEEFPINVYRWGSRSVSAALGVAMLSMIYRFMPRIRMRWGVVLAGAALAGLLFALLQHLMSWYLSSAGVGTAFGAAGSLVVFLFWVYYSIQAVFFGAAFAKVLDDEKK